MKYRPEIDGLRAIAVIPVIFFHAGIPPFSGGYVGVDIFFVISGYLITSIILSEHEVGSFSIIKFYERRARRILPALLLVVTATLPFAWFTLLPSDLTNFSMSLVSISTFLSNVFFWTERGYFGTATELKPFVHTWSLAIEEQYYVLFPFALVIVATRWRRLLLPALLLGAASSFALCVWVTRIHIDSAFYLLPTRFWELLVGSILAVQCRYHPQPFNDSRLYRPTLELLGLGLIFFAIFAFDGHTQFPGYAALAPVAGTALIIRNGNEQTMIGRMLCTRLLVGIGLISYSAYLWHQPLFALARHQNALSPPGYVFVGLMLATLVLAYLSWRYIEAPFRSRDRWTRKGVFTFSFAGLFVVFFIGAIGWANEGFIGRYSASDQRLLSSFIGAGDYVAARFDGLQDRDFPNDGRKKILVIGDSFGKDVVNAVAESPLASKFAISSHQINSECGNLYLEDSFVHHIDQERLPRCRVLGWYEDEDLKRLLRDADAIWLVSAWSGWVAELLPRSVDRLEQTYGKPVVVFGRKNFGEVNQRTLVSLSPEERLRYVVPLKREHMLVQDAMVDLMDGMRFINVSDLICHSESHCKLFTKDGGLISYDGAHLTKDGAAHLGDLLYRHPVIERLYE